VDGGKVEGVWTYEYHEDTDKVSEDDENKGYSSPEYYFLVKVKASKSRSGLLEFKDWIAIELKDEEGNPLPDEDYVLYLPDGSIRKGKLNSTGYKKEEKIPAGNCSVKFPNRLHVNVLISG